MLTVNHTFRYTKHFQHVTTIRLFCLDRMKFCQLRASKADGINHRLTLVMLNGDCFHLVLNEEFYHSGRLAKWSFVRLRSVSCPNELANCKHDICLTSTAHRSS
ncbi:hypothetical protein AHF37_12161 [Paragonimus kellicotti]|nr:hypothetical protein AHF37_12161 [Paragonimus kellicotti]